MDTVTLVEDQIEDGQKLIESLRRDHFDVAAACWIRPTDDDRWTLYLVSKEVDNNGSLGYQAVVRALRELPDPSFSTSETKLIGEKHPLARDVLDLPPRFTGRITTRLRRPVLGGIPVDEVYVYPSGPTVTVPIYGLGFRGDPGGLLYLAFEPHNPTSTFTVESNGVQTKYPGETGTDWVVSAPPGSKLTRNQAGLMELVWNWLGTEKHSNANEVLSLAQLGLHGFQIVKKPT